MNWLILFEEIIPACTENHTKQVENEDLSTVEVGRAYSYHWDLNG
jgi:hypothetical protein